MSCERYVGAIVDHACGAEMTGELARHLSSCEGCAARLAAERRMIAGLDAAIQSALDVEASESFERGVHARVAASTRSGGFWWSAAGLGIAAALLVAASLGRSSRDLPARPELSVRAPAPIEATPALPLPRRTPPSKPRVVRRLTQVEVIVSPDRARAVSEYLRLVRNRGFEAPNLDGASKAIAGPPKDLVVEPLAIDPIVLPDVEVPARPVPLGREQQ
jgi:hypothetical protein